MAGEVGPADMGSRRRSRHGRSTDSWIALLDRAHKNHEPVKQIIRHLYVCGAKLYYVQPCYLEILDYWRRKSLTEYLAIRAGSDDGVTGRFEKAYRYHLEELKKHTGIRNDAYFQDYVIKDLRDHLLRVGGKNQREVGRNMMEFFLCWDPGFYPWSAWVR